ncbi:hypothetical protein BH23ACT9_BH23ACT9_35540 [soil metagenome]
MSQSRLSGSLAALLHIVLLTLAMVLTMVIAPTGAEAAEPTRLQAEDAVGAALAWSGVTFADGAGSEVLLARDDVFADALASGGAQGQLGAPLLLTDSEALDPRVVEELQRLGAGRVTLLGGLDALSAGVEAEVTALGYDTDRLQGLTRLETAIDIAETLYPNATTAIIARAFGSDGDDTRAFADSLAAGAFSVATATPLLLTEGDSLSSATRAHLAASTVETVTVAGGTDAVSQAVVADLEGLGLEVTRVAGANRFETAVALAQALGIPDASQAAAVVLIDGTRPDAWASGFPAALQAVSGSTAVVLADGDTLPPATRSFLEPAQGSTPLLCGPFVTATACDEASQALDLIPAT